MTTDGSSKAVASFEEVCSILSFSKDNGLATEKEGTENEYFKLVLSDAAKKLGIDAIFFLALKTGGPGILIVYFKLMDYPAQEEIREIHRLSWNMGQAPLLFIVLPDAVLVYNNLVPPSLEDERAGLIEELKGFSQIESVRRRLKNYERAELETGSYWRKNAKKFRTDNNIFNSLLKNLDYMRRKLISSELPTNVVHSILVRSIFIRYLEDRRDAQGSNVFPEGFFERYSSDAACFTDLLSSKRATFDFFRYLAEKFNGDIFIVEPEEEETIKQEHLELLRRMLTGEEHMENRQKTLWPAYSFAVIPIELISSIYEQFFLLKAEEKRVLPRGIHYTPHHLVSFLMDEVLSTSDVNGNMRIIDPACGSGIFLVESYRRLVNHWISSNHYRRPSSSDLIRILNENLYGVDVDAKAIRIAALSLYLTLCDYLEPKSIWNELKFEKLITRRLFIADFFDSHQDFAAEKYDLIIGNPPWESELSRFAESYIRHSFKPVADKQICQAFLWKSADLCKPDGKICMVVSSKALLFNRSAKMSKFRKSFLSKNTVKAVFNFSALRQTLFSHATGPGAAIIFSPKLPPEGEAITYISPKPSFTLQDELSFFIEPQDIARISLEEALESELIWKVAMWGSPRDHELIRKLSRHPTLRKIADDRGWTEGEGYIVGNKKFHTRDLLGKPEVTPDDLQSYVVRTESLRPCDKDHFWTWGKSILQIYVAPHLLIGQSPDRKHGFTSALMLEDSVFSQSIVGIHSDKRYLSDLIAVCEAVNSDVPLYYAIMTSGRWLVERDELAKVELMSTPIPEDLFREKNDMSLLEKLAGDEGFRKVRNNRLMNIYGLDESERILVADAIKYTLDYFLHRKKSEAVEIPDNNSVKEYLALLCQILNNEFSPSDQWFQGTIYRTKGPLRMVSLRLLDIGKRQAIEEQNEEGMEDLLRRLDRELIEKKSGSIYIRRHLWRYSKNSVFIIKPNQTRYWTKSSAILDSDKIYAEIMNAGIMRSWRNRR